MVEKGRHDRKGQLHVIVRAAKQLVERLPGAAQPESEGCRHQKAVQACTRLHSDGVSAVCRGSKVRRQATRCGSAVCEQAILVKWGGLH